MKTYQIISSAGVEMGIYHGETESDALEAMAFDAGYESFYAAETVGKFEGTVKEVEVEAEQWLVWSFTGEHEVDGTPVMMCVGVAASRDEALEMAVRLHADQVQEGDSGEVVNV